MIQISELGLLRGSKHLLEQTNATIYPGHKVGLVGPNGCGKSSLFALLQGQLSPDTGECQIPKGWRLVSVAQETPASDKSALDYVIDGDQGFRALQQALVEAEHANQGERIAQLHGELEQMGAYQIEARAATILAGLGFSQEQLQQKVQSFSGGWRMRLNLAQALLVESDLLLLDEPTNHLDLDAVIWLEKWLASYTGTLILISHDRAFLDACVQEILSIESQTLVSYTGNYSSFEKQKAERLRLQSLEYQKQQAKIAHLHSFIDRFRAKASKAKQAQSRIKQLEKMEMLLPAHSDSQFQFSFFTPPKLPNPLIYMEEVTLGYGEKQVLAKVKLNLVPGSRIGLLGRNGAGKSTLIKALSGQLAPQSGIYETSAGLSIGYFAQHQLELLRPDDTPIQHLQRLDAKATEQQLRDYLGGFAFHGDAALEPVAPMSGGEKARLVLALIIYQKPNLLLLDEPTNHLDLNMRDALNLALQGFEGAMILVSHDRFLLSAVCEEYYLVDAGQVAPFSGDLDDYSQWLFNSNKETVSKDAPKSQKNRQEIKRLEAEQRQATKPWRDKLKKAEQLVESLENRLQVLEQTLAEPELYQAEQKDKLKSLLEEQASLKSQLADQEESWMLAQDKLDEMEQAFAAKMASL